MGKMAYPTVRSGSEPHAGEGEALIECRTIHRLTEDSK